MKWFSFQKFHEFSLFKVNKYESLTSVLMQLGMKIIFWKILYTLYEIHSYLGDKQDSSWAILKVNFIESFFFFTWILPLIQKVLVTWL